MEKRHLTFSVLVERAEDVPGLWVAHCLDNDVISTGMSPAEAMDMVNRALVDTFLDDLVHRFDFSDRKGAPNACWDKFRHIVKNGQPTEGLPQDAVSIAALVQMVIAYELHERPTALEPTLDAADDLLPKENSDEWPDITPLRFFNDGAGNGACQSV